MIINNSLTITAINSTRPIIIDQFRVTLWAVVSVHLFYINYVTYDIIYIRQYLCSTFGLPKDCTCTDLCCRLSLIISQLRLTGILCRMIKQQQRDEISKISIPALTKDYVLTYFEFLMILLMIFVQLFIR